MKEEKLPIINGEVTIRELRIEQKMTQPPKRYSAASLVKELEKRNLGTKATRASIIETLYDRGYVKERSLEATPLGLKLIETLRKYSPIIVDETLTRELEEEVEDMQVHASDLEKREEKVLDKAKKSIIQITRDMRAKEEAIGKELSEGTEEMWEQEKEDAKLTTCQKCGKGNLRVMYNRASRRFFVGCSNYPECKNTFSLPPNSLIKTVKDAEGNPELCKECKGPMLLAIRKAKRPWKFCFNPECVTNREWREKAEKRREAIARAGEKSERPDGEGLIQSAKKVVKEKIVKKERKS
jgi:DNA topoisomerase-1